MGTILRLFGVTFHQYFLIFYNHCLPLLEFRITPGGFPKSCGRGHQYGQNRRHGGGRIWTEHERKHRAQSGTC